MHFFISWTRAYDLDKDVYVLRSSGKISLQNYDTLCTHMIRCYVHNVEGNFDYCTKQPRLLIIS